MKLHDIEPIKNLICLLTSALSAALHVFPGPAALVSSLGESHMGRFMGIFMRKGKNVKWKEDVLVVHNFV